MTGGELLGLIQQVTSKTLRVAETRQAAPYPHVLAPNLLPGAWWWLGDEDRWFPCFAQDSPFRYHPLGMIRLPKEARGKRHWLVAVPSEEVGYVSEIDPAAPASTPTVLLSRAPMNGSAWVVQGGEAGYRRIRQEDRLELKSFRLPLPWALLAIWDAHERRQWRTSASDALRQLPIDRPEPN